MGESDSNPLDPVESGSTVDSHRRHNLTQSWNGRRHRVVNKFTRGGRWPPPPTESNGVNTPSETAVEQASKQVVRMSAFADPWRLCCPECGGHTLLTQSNGWRCRGCDSKFTKIMDKRDNRLRSKRELAQL